ncbi:MAG: hypothetical protein HFH06_12575 [Lachnospiraceae bacterium]|nr:hypothetical protein [Lachnospiraceae bacterium]
MDTGSTPVYSTYLRSCKSKVYRKIMDLQLFVIVNILTKRRGKLYNPEGR